MQEGVNVPVFSSLKRLSRSRRPRGVSLTIGVTCVLLLAGCAGAASSVGAGGSSAGSSTSNGSAADAPPDQFGTEYENTGTGPMTTPTIPTTPSVPTYLGS